MLLEGRRVTFEVCVLFDFFSMVVKPFESSIRSSKRQIISARISGWSLSLEKNGSENVMREHSTRRSRNLKKVKHDPVILGNCSKCRSTALLSLLRDFVRMSSPVGV